MVLKAGSTWKTRRIDNEHAQMSVGVCAPQTPTTYASNTYLAMDSTMSEATQRAVWEPWQQFLITARKPSLGIEPSTLSLQD